MNKKYFISLFILLSVLTFGQKEYYELRKYELPYNSSEKELHLYLKNALIPALNQKGIKNIGVFEDLGNSIPKIIYLLIPYQSIEMYSQAITALNKDKNFLKKRKEYDRIRLSKKVYNRYTTSFLIAFDGLPKLINPKPGSKLFELRTYEGYSEDAVRRKIKMFNEGELLIFKETGLNSVFFGEQVSGSLMPALTYMLSFSSMEERDVNWKKFADHPEWKRMSALKEYEDTVSDIKRNFLKPLSYSQL